VVVGDAHAPPGTVLAVILFPDRWDVHVDWPHEGVGVNRADRLVLAGRAPPPEPPPEA
jgi:hypothetical protein